MYENRQYRVVNPKPQFTLGVVEGIIIVNVLLFLPWLTYYLTRNTNIINTFLLYSALHIGKPYQYTINNGAVWQIITSIFTHGGLMHLFFNMYALYIFGKPLEQRWGKIKFLSFYLTTGILANIATVVFFMFIIKQPVSILGASGAVFGILLAFGGYYPEATLLLFFVIPLKVKWVVLLYAAIEIIMEITGTMDGIAHITHLFGLLFAFFYLLLFFKINPIKEMFFPDKNKYFYQ